MHLPPPTPVLLSIDRKKADEALDEFNRLYDERHARFTDPAQRINLEKLIAKQWSGDPETDPHFRWLNVEVQYNTRIRITPGDGLLLVLRALKGEEQVSRDVSEGELQQYLQTRQELHQS